MKNLVNKKRKSKNFLILGVKNTDNHGEEFQVWNTEICRGVSDNNLGDQELQKRQI